MVTDHRPLGIQVGGPELCSFAAGMSDLRTAPALIVRPAREPLATLLWYHGLGVDKETHRAELERFAGAGILAIGIDAAGHGERRLPDFEERFAPPREVIEPLLFQLVNESVDEVPRIIDELIARGLDSDGCVAVAGVSFGAYIAYRAMPRDARLRACVALLGTPPESLDGFHPRPLLSMTAEQDVNVPPEKARAFHAALEERYRDVPERLRYREFAGATHFLTAAEWDEAIGATIDWVRTACAARTRD